MNLLKNMTVLSDDDIKMIDMRVMETLEDIGTWIDEEESLQLLEENGARVDYEKKRAYMPPDLVKRCLESKADSFVMYDSDGTRSVFMGGKSTYYAPLGYAVTYLDTDGISYEGTYDALLRESKLVDAMDEYQMMHPSIQPVDKPEYLQDIYMVKAMLVGTRKPIHCVANSGKNAEAIIRMHAEIVGGMEELERHPRHMFNLCTFSPLGIRRDCCEVIREAAKHNVPCMFSTGGMAGATAPVTLAGSIVMSMAEVIGHLVLAVIQKPGMRVAMLHASRIFDMKAGTCTVATPEYNVLKVAAAQMAQYYKIPIGSMTFCSDSNEYDVQYGWEKFATAFISKQSGMNMLFGGGMFAQLNQFGFAGLAMDTEIINVIERIGRGMEVDEERMAIEVLASEAEAGGFLSNPHTRKNFKNEFMFPEISNRRTYAQYEAKPGPNFEERAKELLEKYEKKYNYTIGLEHEEALDRIIDEYK